MNSAGFCTFLSILQDFADLAKLRGPTAAQNTRSPACCVGLVPRIRNNGNMSKQLQINGRYNVALTEIHMKIKLVLSARA